MTSIREAVKRLLQPNPPLPAGVYHYQSPSQGQDVPAAHPSYRLHLRLEPNGEGILIVNAATVLHLNRTAAEFAYHLIQQTPVEQIATQLSKRYRVSAQQAQHDFEDVSGRILDLVETPDLDPETFLDFERLTPHTFTGAPYRLDCALTYRLPVAADPTAAPIQAVTRELTTDEWKTVLEKAWAAGLIHITFTGGEPTLREDLPDLIRQAETNGQVTGLLTDGLRLADPAYLDLLLQTGLDHLMLLCQTENPVFWQALDNAIAADIHVTVHLTLTPAEVALPGAPEALLHKLAEKGVHAVSLSAATPELAEMLPGLRSLAAGLSLPLVWDLPVPFSAFNPVALETAQDQPVQGAGKAWLYLEPDGDLKPSQSDPRLLGNFLRDPWEALQSRLTTV